GGGGRRVLGGGVAAVGGPAAGAGAAGLGGARGVAAATRRFVLLEASDRIGGRCVTDTTTFGVPFDFGAHWIHRPDGSLLTGSAQATALEIYSAPRGQTVRVGPRNARDSELETFVPSLVRARRAIVDAGRGRADAPAARVLQADLGDWRSTLEFVLAPFPSRSDLPSL